MKGIIFTEFLEMVESKHGYELVDFLLTRDGLISGGVYTAIGTYDASEMFVLVSAYTAKTGQTADEVLRGFGKHMFGVFKEKYPEMIDGAGSAFDFLESIEAHIHVEVRKLYPEAELPTFAVRRLGAKKLEMNYFSARRMAGLAHGLIESAMAHFGEQASISRVNLKEDESEVRFVIELQ